MKVSTLAVMAWVLSGVGMGKEGSDRQGLYFRSDTTRMTDHLFRSERLGFRAWRGADQAMMAAINADPEVMRFFPGTVAAEQTNAFVERMQVHLEQKGFCYYAVDDLWDGGFIGFIGMMVQEYPAAFTPCVDIGWRLKRAYWGQGLATEGARRCLDHAFTDLGMTEVLATAPLVNRPSIRVMEKVGMGPRGTFIHPYLVNDPRLKECVLYGINAPR